MTKLVTENVLINGYRIACGSHGEGSPVILIHGTPSFSHIWRNVLPTLTAAGHKVYLFDLLGYGYSERPHNPEIDTSVSAQVEILQGLLDYWDLENAHIVSHDIAGGIAMRYAIFNPERVKTLTIIDSVSFDSWPSKRTKAQMQQGLESLINASDADHRTHFTNWLESAVYNKEGLKNTAMKDYIEMISGPVGQASFFQHQVMHYDSRHTEEITDRLAELGNQPVQLIWGENDAWQLIEWAHKLHAAIPGSNLTILSECGHFAMEDQPEKIAELVNQFIEQNNG